MMMTMVMVLTGTSMDWKRQKVLPAKIYYGSIGKSDLWKVVQTKGDQKSITSCKAITKGRIATHMTITKRARLKPKSAEVGVDKGYVSIDSENWSLLKSTTEAHKDKSLKPKAERKVHKLIHGYNLYVTLLAYNIFKYILLLFFFFFCFHLTCIQFELYYFGIETPWVEKVYPYSGLISLSILLFNTV